MTSGFFRSAMLACTGVFLCGPVLASPEISDHDALIWLQRMNQAARSLNYSGVFVYQTRDRSETSRITHMVDATGEMEKLETLDGAPREVVRIKDEVRSYLPNDKLVVLDRAGSIRFPGRLLSMASSLSEYYVLRLSGVSRVAGREAQKISLFPRDPFRYGHQIWADIESGVLLKARLVNDQSETLEQFGFTEIELGLSPDRERVKTRYTQTEDWQVFNARSGDVRPEDVAWVFKSLPPGYRQISSQRRSLKRDAVGAYHAVFSDGLASISVFIEQVDPRGGLTRPPSSSGPIGIYKRMHADHQITVLGEVPMAALQRVAEGVEARRR